MRKRFLTVDFCQIRVKARDSSKLLVRDFGLGAQLRERFLDILSIEILRDGNFEKKEKLLGSARTRKTRESVCSRLGIEIKVNIEALTISVDLVLLVYYTKVVNVNNHTQAHVSNVFKKFEFHRNISDNWARELPRCLAAKL